ncbi:MAG: hypothetical protein JWO45_205 [Spartobacteria bacterium]|nr:hypothetical protein [Spartobacteria bacterium]
MNLREIDFFHGAALTRIVESKNFTALNKCDDKYGHYVLNHNVRLLVKYSSADDGPWQFTFAPDDLRVLAEDFAITNQQSFVCLVCGRTSICLLSKAEVLELMDVNLAEQQGLRVECPPNSSMRVYKGDKALKHAVPHNAFPEKLFSREGVSV